MHNKRHHIMAVCLYLVLAYANRGNTLARHVLISALVAFYGAWQRVPVIAVNLKRNGIRGQEEIKVVHSNLSFLFKWHMQRLKGFAYHSLNRCLTMAGALARTTAILVVRAMSWDNKLSVAMLTGERYHIFGHGIPLRLHRTRLRAMLQTVKSGRYRKLFTTHQAGFLDLPLAHQPGTPFRATFLCCGVAVPWWGKDVAALLASKRQRLCSRCVVAFLRAIMRCGAVMRETLTAVLADQCMMRTSRNICRFILARLRAITGIPAICYKLTAAILAFEMKARHFAFLTYASDKKVWGIRVRSALINC
jgi:hypothetical protein